MSRGIGHRRGWDPALLWLWCSPAAVAPIQPLAWEPPYVMSAKAKKKKKKNFCYKKPGSIKGEEREGGYVSTRGISTVKPGRLHEKVGFREE